MKIKDPIYREDAIEAIHSYWKGELSKMPTTDSEYGEVIDGDCDTLLKHNKELSTRIKEIPSAYRPQGEWIPCSERLPNYREAVLVSTFWGVRMAERDSIKEDGTDDFWYLFLDDATARPMYVYAWMPLPEPWKGADDDRV